MRSAFQNEELEAPGQESAQEFASGYDDHSTLPELFAPDKSSSDKSGSDKSGSEKSSIDEADSDNSRPAQFGSDRELTISTTTLLAVFFGLVLLCALFFGLGYTFGRRAPAESVSAASVETPAYGSQYKPSAATTPAISAPSVSMPADLSASEPAPDASQAQPAQPQEEALQPAAATAESPVPKPQSPLQSQPGEPAAKSQPSAPATSAGIMVQVAAISNPADADVLVRALQQHGYTASARHLPPDSLIHVQIGPFANRTDAIAMKQKLLGDGYNAILKP